jgi:polysaccharide pyruvyl transferase WcaK-like protein
MDAFTIYSQVHAVISGRMHPLIMAAMVGTLPIAYGGRSKVKSLVSMTGMPELSLEQPTSQLATIRALLSQRAEIVNRLSAALDTFRTDVEDSLTKVLTL